MEKKWKLIDSDQSQIEKIYNNLGGKINKNICKILIQRGLHTTQQITNYFKPALKNLYDPFMMKDMDKGVDKILDAIDKNKKILILGDYDVDGTTSVAVLYSFLKEWYANVIYYIPNRYKEGYGVSKTGIDFAIENSVELLITVDCGIKSEALIQYALDNHIETIICDHHIPPETLPPAIAILNPKQIDCLYPCKDLCGCAIIFKLISAIAKKKMLPSDSYLRYIDLVAVAIAADIVPIVDENRTLTYIGLEKINSNPQNGLKALLQYFKHDNNIKVKDIVFLVTPRINAAGRMDDAKKAVELFIAKDMETADILSRDLNIDNDNRRSLDKDTFEEAKSLIEKNETEKNKKSTIVYQPHWSKGVIGIVASRLIENFYKPTIVLCKSENIISGSGRSVEGFDLHNALEKCSDYLIGFGGHFAAAGLTLLEENLQPFKEAFENAVQQCITEEQLNPYIYINAEITFKEITDVFYNILQKMEPLGTANMQPIFLSKNVRNNGYSAVVKENHIKFGLIQNGVQFYGIGFNLSHKFNIIETGKPFDIIYKIELEKYKDRISLKLHVIDING